MNEIYVANVRDPITQDVYLEEAPEAPVSSPVPLPDQVPIVQFHQLDPLPNEPEVEPQQEAQLVAEPEVPVKKRHITTQEERKTLARLFHHHENEPNYGLENYVKDSGLTEGTVKRFLAKLRKGESIDTARVRKGRLSKFSVDDSRAISEAVRLRPTQPLADLRAAVLVERRKKRRDNGEDVDLDADFTEEEIHAFSLQALNEHIRGDRMVQHGFSPLTVKSVSIRNPAALSDDLKTKRIAIAKRISDFYISGREIFFIDETSWTNCHTRRRGRASRGEQAFHYTTGGTRVSLTCITAISTTGRKYSHLLQGTVTQQIFMSFVQRFLSHRSESGQRNPIVIYLDNASIHSKQALGTLCQQTGHTLVMGPEYTPAMNPIELVFGWWKAKVDSYLQPVLRPSETEYKSFICTAFKDMSEEQIRASINHVLYVVYPKIHAREDV